MIRRIALGMIIVMTVLVIGAEIDGRDPQPITEQASQ